MGELDGDVMGELCGDDMMGGHMATMGFSPSTVGYTVVGELEGEGGVMEGEIVGEGIDAATGRRVVYRRMPVRRAAGNVMRLPPPMPWRGQVITPGVNKPHPGLVSLPLKPDLQGGVWTAGLGSQTTITWEGRPQKPFRGERLIAKVTRVLTVANAMLQAIYVGTDLQQAEVGPQDVEFYVVTAFGVREVWDPAGPGVLIRLPVQPDIPVGGIGESLRVTMKVQGQYVS